MTGERPCDKPQGSILEYPYVHSKMEGLFLLKEIIIPRDQMCEIDLKEAYFTISSKEISETRQISMDVQAVPV